MRPPMQKGEEMETYQIYNHGGTAVCPVCGGYLKPRTGLDFLCVDCGTYFFPLKTGQAERELRYGFIKARSENNEIAV